MGGGGNLRTYLHCRTYSLPITFSKIVPLATLAELHFILQLGLLLEIQACNVSLPTLVIFNCILVLIIPDSSAPKCIKTHIKSHKIAYKMSKNR